MPDSFNIREDGIWVGKSALLVSLDTETGGFSADKNALLSVSICIPRPGDLDTPSTWLIFPEQEFDLWVHPQAAEVNGYDLSLWKKAGAFQCEEALHEFLTSLEKLKNKHGAKEIAFIAHNAPFDRRFMKAAFQRYGYSVDEYSWRWFCTQRTMQKYAYDLGHYGNYQLESCCRSFNIAPRRHEIHESGEDAVLAGNLALSFLQRNCPLVEVH